MRCGLRSTGVLLVVLTAASIVGASDARSAGYWVRWSSCGGIGAADPAALEQSGTRPGRLLLDDLLENPGIVWDDGQDDELVVRIATCKEAVSVLEDGASGADGVSALARELLAAQLNLMAGVTGCPDVAHEVILAEDLLDTLDFDPTAPRADADVMSTRSGASDVYSETALELAAELRRFNLGRGCSTSTEDVERGGS